ncbi:MAG: alpha-1,4-glucan--maltose-1-phosphate maltosyltransferase [Labilithrix sp.]|nr:alpha-1,4-glucan--maltose-1-phosphate maltosyltransferase [Labilithrix sp.]
MGTPVDSTRVLIEGISPEVDGGRYAVKRVIGDRVVVECDLVADGHDAIAGRVVFRRAGDSLWQRAPLEPLENDRWRSSFVVDAVGRWEYAVEAWIDRRETLRRAIVKKREAGQDVSVELVMAERLDATKRELDRVSRSAVLSLVVDPLRARFSAWYELFPRSWGPPEEHGTFRDVEEKLDYVARMGFDVLYFPPIHPVGRSFRKGPNNTLTARPGDPGSPWAIGDESGGHTAVHRALGTLEDLRRLTRAARAKGLEIALDVAFQASPDHPWVRQHPDWFFRRPDGTIQYAENPPKKYQDVYPFDFECEDWRSLWSELRDVFFFWLDQGVRIFRVDNPHTKSLRFWEWCITEVKAKHPETIFLSEAFTRPKVMFALSKAGFTQSYTYFTWRTTKQELETYVRELARSPLRDHFRPNFWPNTPDILPEHLQEGERATFLLRLALAATLSSNYGIYGPSFELMEHVARPGAEEYLDSEKFQLRAWNLDDPRSLRDEIAAINRARRDNPALQQSEAISFHRADDDALFAYSKRAEDNVVLVVANVDPRHRRAGRVHLDPEAVDAREGESVELHDVLSGERSTSATASVYVELDPAVRPYAIFVVRRSPRARRVRSERDFEYFL